MFRKCHQSSLDWDNFVGLINCAAAAALEKKVDFTILTVKLFNDKTF